MDSEFEKNINNLWHRKRLFHMEKDKFKPRIFLNNGTIDLYNDSINISLYKGLIINDIYSRYFKMRGYNVYFSFGYNNISKASFFKKNTTNQKEQQRQAELESNIHFLGLSNDVKKELNCNSSTFTEFPGKFFLYLNEQGLIKIANRQVYTDEDNSNIYNCFDVSSVNNCFYLKSTGKKVKESIKSVVILDIKDFAPAIISEINKLNVEEPVKKKLKSVLMPNYGLKITLTNTFKDIYFDIEMDHPEYIGGLDYIAMNPDFIDTSAFISDEEKFSVERFNNGMDVIGVYSGTYFVNPLTGRAIPIIISRKYDKAYHLGISSIFKNDYLFCGLLHLDYENIIEDDTIINSDFISNMNKKDAHIAIIEAFSKEDFASRTYTFLNTEIIISTNDDYGLLIPLYYDGIKYHSTPKEFLPFFLANKVSLALQSKKDFANKVEVIDSVFNQYYVLGVADIAKRLFANERELPDFSDPCFVDIYNEYSVTEQLVIEENHLISDILMPLIFRIIMKKRYKNLRDDSISKTIILYNRDKYEKNIDLSMISSTYSIDALRMYLAVTPKNSLESLNYTKLEYCKQFINEVSFMYSGAKNNNFYKNDFYEVSSKLHKYLFNGNITAYTRVLTDYVSTLKNEVISYKFGLSILKLLYIIIPHVCERIYLEKYNSKHFLIYDEWTV